MTIRNLYCFGLFMLTLIKKKMTAKEDRWFKNKKRRERETLEISAWKLRRNISIKIIINHHLSYTFYLADPLNKACRILDLSVKRYTFFLSNTCFQLFTPIRNKLPGKIISGIWYFIQACTWIVNQRCMQIDCHIYGCIS